ncbi:NFACT RNA binding domain-containing protein [Ignavibacterium sp.]|uniref:NFACT RNA binding domain-containing protein n=1 Tax=Ignavibacterium sp. TaxID=2651167 RepID=UPI00307DE4BF
MIKSYFFLNRQLIELRESLLGKKILEAFTQEKDKLVVSLEDEDNLYLEFCVNHSVPYYLIRDFYIRSKKNSLDIFENIRYKRISDLIIADDDRVVAFLLDDNSVLYFTIRGKLTNIYYKTSSEFLSFKKTEAADLLNVEKDILEKQFISEFNAPEFSTTEAEIDDDSIRSKFPFIGKEIIQYAKSIDDNSIFESLRKVLEIIKRNNPIVLINYNTYEIRLSFKGLQLNDTYFEIHEFEKVNDALIYYVKELHLLALRKEKIEFVLKNVEKEFKRLTNKQNNLLTIIQQGNKEGEYKKIGNLLLINLNNIHPGMNKISINDIYENDKILEINLDPKLSPKENVDKYFEKAKESKIRFEKAKEIIEIVEKEKQRLNEAQEKLQSTKSLKEIEQIAKGLKLKMPTEKNLNESIIEKFKHYLIDGKYHVYVGKDSKSNDVLTLKFAKQNDYWFHARSVPGSHVVLRVDNTKEPIPKSVLKKVASIAAFHSKAKTAGVVSVSYTVKKYVVKRKGMEPGKVALLKEDTLLVSPEIPHGVEYIES